MGRVCCAVRCNGRANHSFPTDPQRRAKWEEALICDGKGYVKRPVLGLCEAHFKPEDFITESFNTGLKLTRKVLKRTAIPSIFKSSEILVEEDLSFVPDVKTKKDLPETSEDKRSLTPTRGTNRKRLLRSMSVGTQKDFCFFGIENFKENPAAILFYTGLQSYAHFKKVFHSLCPPSDLIKYYPSEVLDFPIPIEDQLFLSIIKLKRNKEDFELGLLFQVDMQDVQNLFIIWVNFMHRIWSNYAEWPINSHLDFYLKKLYSSPRVIVKVPVEKRKHSSSTNKSGEKTGIIIKRNKVECSTNNFSNSQEMSVQTLISSESVANMSSIISSGTYTKPNNVTVFHNGNQDSNPDIMGNVIKLTKRYCILETCLQNHGIEFCKKIYGVCHVLFEKW